MIDRGLRLEWLQHPFSANFNRSYGKQRRHLRTKRSESHSV